uniref:testis-specific serine/threonine-protein kinase 1-like n=1 Tax=Ciona intestinalis TaxID=7719 RepID=UPI000180C420|nr:testis-specific serine/threonine-protein kinase 1-like [Ciona intestinalis]|eukprot:XP_002130366.1 testis-specific serine/threonine-protein kinase 1-like [Ciona intestinalis]
MGKIKSFFSADDTNHLKKKGYTVLGDLGEGTYSKVKQASWVKPGDTSQVKVALKIINKKTAPKDFLEKFLPREIEVMKKLKHPNLIRLYELFQISSKLYFTLEWGGHGDLLQYIRLRGPLKDSESHKFFTEMCTGVEYMHQVGVVHRDLKCENVLLSKKNSIKIADFGFAREIGPNENSKTYCGSAAYAAPELLQGIPYKGTIADIWSLGVILYIMCCSSMPFRDANIKTLIKDQKDTLHIPSSVAGTLNSSLKDLMKKIMRFDLNSRFMMPHIKSHAWFIGKKTGDEHTAESSKGPIKVSSTSKSK